jgi:hypothetical protein
MNCALGINASTGVVDNCPTCVSTPVLKQVRRKKKTPGRLGQARHWSEAEQSIRISKLAIELYSCQDVKSHTPELVPVVG